MNKINERIALIRKTLNLSMEKFGNRIGISKSSISGFEKGTVNPSEQSIKLICREFNVDYFWLTEGFGEMFTALPETLLDELVDEYHLDKDDKMILKIYLEAPEEEQKAIKNFLLTLAEKLQNKGE